MALLDNIPGWKVFSTGLGIAALCVVGYFVYAWFIAGPDDLKEKQQGAVEDALNQLAAKYEEKVRLEGDQNVVVMPVSGQETSEGQIRHMIINRLGQVAGIKAAVPKDPTLEERAIGVLKSALDKEVEGPDPTAVFEKSGEADEVLSVHVDKLWSGPDNGVCIIDVTRIVRDNTPERKARVLDAERITGRSGAGTVNEVTDSGPGFWAGFGKFIFGLLVVLAVTAILPFMSWPLAKAAFNADSNAANGALLIGLTVLDMAAVFVFSALATASAFSTTSIVSAGLLLPLALVWNLRLLNFIEER